MDDWVWWMIAAGVLAIGEIATLGFFLGPIAIAAVTAAIVALAGAGLAAQWIVFIAVSLASLLVLRPIAKRHLRTPGEAADRDRRARRPARPWCSSASTATAARSSSRARSGRPVPTMTTRRSKQGARVEVMKIDGATALVAE